jgi:hypothetical protein
MKEAGLRLKDVHAFFESLERGTEDALMVNQGRSLKD